MNKILFPLLLLAGIWTSFPLAAQQLTINGTVHIEGESAENATLEILKNGQIIERKTMTKRGNFNLRFAFGADYRLTFRKEGYVHKIVSINTEVPEEVLESNPDFPPVKLIIKLLPAIEGIDLSVFDQAIAILLYNQEIDDFSFDKEYSANIQQRILTTEQAIRRTLQQRGAAEIEKAREAAREQAERQKQLAALDEAYLKALTQADEAFNRQDYEPAVTAYREAARLKPDEEYPKRRLDEARKRAEALRLQREREIAQQKLDTERKNTLLDRYARLIAEADAAFNDENYALARLRYTEAQNLRLGEEYPAQRIREIDGIINSAKYKARLAEYNAQKALAEKSMQQKNYAGAKIYYQKALAILSIDREEIQKRLLDIDRIIEAARLAEIEKPYREHIRKADDAFNQKAYAVARYYYRKALEVKPADTHAAGRLREVESHIGSRQEKETEL